MRQRVRAEGIAASFDLAPRDIAVVVTVEANSMLEIE